MKYLSLFSGIGGFELGIQQALKIVQVSFKKRRQFDCVGYAEIDKHAACIYERHFGNHKNYGDVTKIKTSELPDFDLLVGGFPCQAFSIAGKRKGFEDSRGEVFFEIARILRAKKPRLVFLENVKGLLSHNNGKTFKTIITSLVELGYDVQWQVLNSKNFGVPQNRERVFIIGHLRGTGRPKVFPFGKSDKKNIVVPTLTARYYGAQSNGGYIRIPVQKKRLRIFEATKKGGFTYATKGDGISYDYPRSKTRHGRVIKDKTHTLTTSMSQGTVDGMKLRYFTPTECERLQGFPDGWTEGVSDTQRYKCLGNAVTVNVIREIMVAIISSTKF